MTTKNGSNHGPKRTPRSLLQKARFDRGWSQQQVVDRVRAICPGHGNHGSCRMDVAKVSDYERRARRPSVTHIQALARIYERSPEDLGLISWRDHPDDEAEEPSEPLVFLVIPIGRGADSSGAGAAGRVG